MTATASAKARFKRNHPDLLRILRLLLYEAESFAAHWRGCISIRQRVRIRKLKGASGLRCNLACGRATEPGWLNIDASPSADICVDLRRPLPLRNESVALIFCEHFCDHLNFPYAIQRFLAECHRLLQPSGRARFVLHDATDLMRACVEQDSRYFEVAEVVRATPMESVNFLFRFDEGHQFLYDFATFEGLLLAAGFQRVERCEYGVSRVAGLALDMRHPSRQVMSMYIEAEK